MAQLADVMQLVRDALDEFDSPGVTAASVVRRAIRIARLRNDFVNLVWLQMEADGLDNLTPTKAIQQEAVGHFTRDDWKTSFEPMLRELLGRREIADKKTHTYPDSVEGLETRIANLRGQISELKAPPGMHPVDLYFRDAEYTKARAELLKHVNELQAVVGRIRQRVFTFLSQTERELAYGQANADIFERNRQYVDARVGVIAPEVVDQFASAYRRVLEGDDEARSQALTSCRRILKSLADYLYPATAESVEGFDGVAHKLTDDRFVARIIQFTYEQTKGHASGELLKASIESLTFRIERLNDLASKGVHASVTQAEVEQTVIQTYLAVGDLLRLRDGISAIQIAAA
jgi:hypothetical protein